jgi:hypothetical protein
MRTPFVVVAMLAYCGCIAQTGYSKRYDPLEQLRADLGWSLEPCDAGGYLLVSNSPWTDSVEYGSVITILHIDEEGDLLDHHRFIDTNYWNYPGWANSSDRMMNGGLVVGGNRVSAQEDSRTSIFVFDPLGTPLQQFHFGELGQTWVGRQAKQTPDGGFVLTGSRSLNGNTDGFLIKTDANGAQEWVQTYGGASYDEFLAVDVAPGGGYYLGGYRYVPGSSSQHWTLRVDSFGEEAWSRTWGGQFTDPAAHLLATTDGHAVVASANRYNSNNGPALLYMAKLDSTDGSFVWEHFYGAPTFNTTLFAVQEVEPFGDLIATGQAFQNDGEVGVLLRTTSEGDSLWMRYYAYHDAVIDTGDAQLRDVLPTPDGGFIAVGVAFGIGPYSQDVWVIKTDSMGCIEPGCNLIQGMETQVTNLRGALSVAPNPVASGGTVQVSIVLPENFVPQGHLRLTVVSDDGRIVKEETLPGAGSAFSFPPSSFSAGLYHLHLSDATRWISGAKLVVE